MLTGRTPPNSRWTHWRCNINIITNLNGLSSMLSLVLLLLAAAGWAIYVSFLPQRKVLREFVEAAAAAGGRDVVRRQCRYTGIWMQTNKIRNFLGVLFVVLFLKKVHSSTFIDKEKPLWFEKPVEYYATQRAIDHRYIFCIFCQVQTTTRPQFTAGKFVHEHLGGGENEQIKLHTHWRNRIQTKMRVCLPKATQKKH